MEAVCHHCGRFLCQDCLLTTSGSFFADNAFAHLRPLVDDQLRHGAHCEDCFHQDLQPWPVVALVSTLLAIVLAWIVWPQFNELQRGLFIGSAVITIGLVNWGMYRLLPLWVTYPEGFLPLLSRTKIQIQEQVQVDFSITGGDYLSSSPTAAGHIEIKLAVGPNDQARYESAPRPKRPLKLQAGFIALEGLKNIQFYQYTGIRRNRNLLQLTQTISPTELKNLCHSTEDLVLRADYHIQGNALEIGLPHDKEFPLLIRPRRTNGGYRLEIIIEAPKKKLLLKYAKDGSEKEGEDPKGLEGKPTLDALSISIPPECEVEHTNGYHDKQDQAVRWYRQRLSVTNPPYAAFIQFRNKLKNDIEFQGTYKVIVDDWTISQLYVTSDEQSKDSAIIRPANGLRLRSTQKKNESDESKWLAPVIEHQTQIEGCLRFNTTHLFSQQMQMASDLPINPEQTEVVGAESLLVAPTHHVINAVVEALTCEKVFVKEVAETLGDVKETGANSYRAKYWQIKGKYFVEGTLQSVHLHLVIMGEGPQSYRPNCEGLSSFELCLRSYVEMTDFIEKPEWLQGEYSRLKNVIKIAAYQGRQVDDEGQRILAEPREKQLEQMLRRQYRLNDNSMLSVVLTGDGQQCIFITPPTLLEQFSDRSEQMMIFSCDQLPIIGDGWIDKWELVKNAEMELRNGR
ncbi:MAG: hypothetical protein KDJ97_12885 [Anaerolineae bacterium]|nr:hypothetical protein [Anaerolineae bacterium]